MSQQTGNVQQEIATSLSPDATFEELSREQRREVFFSLPETVRGTLVADLSRERLRTFVSRLDPDEATDVLGFFVFLGLAQVVLL
jgi:magnesium transporter